mmetsp:Transcript_45761/g.90831  ORF Transcript_45761/g.90831 Transcript_45761/m.90831 type:complete len:248 (-) Transcript_45761:655-1398(-)
MAEQEPEYSKYTTMGPALLQPAHKSTGSTHTQSCNGKKTVHVACDLTHGVAVKQIHHQIRGCLCIIGFRLLVIGMLAHICNTCSYTVETASQLRSTIFRRGQFQSQLHAAKSFALMQTGTWHCHCASFAHSCWLETVNEVRVVATIPSSSDRHELGIKVAGDGAGPTHDIFEITVAGCLTCWPCKASQWQKNASNSSIPVHPQVVIAINTKIKRKTGDLKFVRQIYYGGLGKFVRISQYFFSANPGQ